MYMYFSEFSFTIIYRINNSETHVQRIRAIYPMINILITSFLFKESNYLRVVIFYTAFI